jgi:hypothetical protein
MLYWHARDRSPRLVWLPNLEPRDHPWVSRGWSVVTPPPPENHCRETGTDQQTVSDSPQPLPRNEKPLFKPVWSPTSMPEDPYFSVDQG